MRILLTCLCFALPLAAGNPLKLDLSSPEGWVSWSPRPEIAPRTFIDPLRKVLAISGDSNAAEHGGWERAVSGIEPGKWYRCVARYQATGVPAENWQVVARIDWSRQDGKRTGGPEYLYQGSSENGWTQLTLDAPAPKDATAAKIQLHLSSAPLATVWWDRIIFEEIPPPGPRNVTIAAIFDRPSSTKAAAVSVKQFMATADRLVPPKTDLILLPEGITVIGTGKSYVDVSETIPGPTTEELGRLARRKGAYVVAGIYEREGIAVYNTAVLMDREGRIAGKYRKVYLPHGEVEGGLTPGNSYPVFQTDFGKVGIMICYDVFFSDPARALGLKGAEMILLPIWGGDEVLAKARAIESRVFLITSGYDHPTYIMDPYGEKIASADKHGSAAIATVDLNRIYGEERGGNMRNRRPREMRLDVSVAEGVPGFGN
jgi:predicted amidohydrolase